MVQQPPADNLPANQDLRQLPLWTRRYARNRTLGVIVSLLAFAMGFGAIGALSWLVAQAGRAHSIPLVVLAGTALLAFCGLWIWLSLGAMTPYLVRATRWLYRHEGDVTLCPLPATTAPRRQGLAAALLVGLPLVALIVAAAYLPPRYHQPLTALWAIPFLTGVWWLQRGQMTPLLLLWPALYAAHAVLILAGVPLTFSGPLQALDILVPMVGYGLLTGLVAHLYSRYALARVRWLGRAAKGEGGGS